MKYTQIPANTFKELQLNAGILCKDFTVASGAVSGLLGATKGGINFTATPSFKDFGEDIDNCPKNMLELKHIESYEVKMSGTFLTVSADAAKMMAGAADITAGNKTYSLTSDTDIVAGKTYYTRTGTSPNFTYTEVENPVKSSLSSYYEITAAEADKIVPRADVLSSDFDDVWFVGDYSDKNGETNGGFVAIKMMNALSTGGFQMQTTDKEKGEFSFEFTGHYSMNAQSTVPYEIYIMSGTDEPNA